MQQINENTFGIRPKFVVKDSTQIFWVELKCPIPLFFIDTYITPNGRITAEGFCIELLKTWCEKNMKLFPFLASKLY